MGVFASLVCDGCGDLVDLRLPTPPTLVATHVRGMDTDDRAADKPCRLVTAVMYSAKF